jgi:hypothetical protein
LYRRSTYFKKGIDNRGENNFFTGPNLKQQKTAGCSKDGFEAQRVSGYRLRYRPNTPSYQRRHGKADYKDLTRDIHQRWLRQEYATKRVLFQWRGAKEMNSRRNRGFGGYLETASEWRR